MNIYTKSLSKELWEDFEKYFESDGSCSGCWCMNHLLPIGLDFEGEAAKLAMKQLILSGRVFGILAYKQGDSIPVGWAALDRKKTLPGHDCIGEEINCDNNEWSIHCVITRKDQKNLGIEEILTEAATKLAFECGAKRIEGYPEPGSNKAKSFATWNTFNGYQDCYENLGYKKIDRNFGEQSEFFYPMEKNVE